MWLMLQQEEPKDYIIATGKTHSIREFAEKTFTLAGLPLRWEGVGIDEKGIDASGTVRVAIDPVYFRPNEVNYLCGDPSRAEKELGWKPKTSLDDLIKIMFDADLKEAQAR
jgi:GDPmannose 4,6-dehydratase